MTLPLDQADKLAQRIAEQLLPFCEPGLCAVAGSIRRRRPFVNDIDLVVLPKTGQLLALKARCKLATEVIKDGEQNMIVRLKNGVQLDVFIAHGEHRDLLETKPTNFGALLLNRTGSTQHNVWLIEHAKSLGLTWNPYHGVFDGDRLLAGATEADIFRALRLDFIEPERRER